MTEERQLSSLADGLTDSRWHQVLADLEGENRELSDLLHKPLRDHYDVVIVGSGAGGGTLAWALRDSGRSVLLVERGPFLPQEVGNWDSDAVLGKQVYANSEPWLDAAGRPYQPFMYHYVGGMTKLYAGTLLRFRAEDFGLLRHPEGLSPSWPVDYDEFEEWYSAAEELYLTHGEAGVDPTEPYRSRPFTHPPLPLAPEIEEFRQRLSAVGLHPFALPQGLDLAPLGRCVYCAYCDSHPCRVLAKADSEKCCIRPALRSPDVTLLSEATARRIITTPDGYEATAVEVQPRDGAILRIRADVIVVACGAVHTAELLLRSACHRHPRGLANSSGLVGANYMRHLSTLLLAQNPHGEVLPQNHYWKTVGLHDYYLDGGPDWPHPLGAIQVTGNYHSQMPAFLPPDVRVDDAGERAALAAQMIPLFLLTEDLPRESNSVTITDAGAVQVTYLPTNVPSHQRLIDVVSRRLREAGYRYITARSFINVVDGGGYHHCGTARFGDDPRTSVLDRNCRAHDVANLYVVDASFFPSSAAVNPVLTIVANALRVGAHLRNSVVGHRETSVR